MDKVSIIIPVYNVKKYLTRCLNSVLSQSFCNLEIILVDDGSSDGSGEICDDYQKIDRRIKVIHKENGGLSDARNVGLDNTTGQFVTLLDSDDWLDSKMVEHLYDAMKNNDADVAECAMNEVFLDQEKSGIQNLESIVKGDNIFALAELLKWKTFKPMACAKLYKRSLFKGIYYPYGRLHEDEFVTYRLFYKAKKLVYIDEALYNYDRTRENSITGKFREQNLDVCDAYKERLDFYKEKKLVELIPEMENHCFWNYLDKLHKCYESNIYTDRVKRLVWGLRENYLENISKDIPIGYKYNLCILQHSFRLFGASYNNVELQEELIRVLSDENWNESKIKKIQDVLEGKKVARKEKNVELSTYNKELLTEIGKYEDVIIYGAGNVGREFYKFLISAELNQKIISFAVTKNLQKKRTVYDRPLLEIRDLAGYRESALVVLAVRERYAEEMEKNLLECGFQHIIKVDRIWN